MLDKLIEKIKADSYKLDMEDIWILLFLEKLWQKGGFKKFRKYYSYGNIKAWYDTHKPKNSDDPEETWTNMWSLIADLYTEKQLDFNIVNSTMNNKVVVDKDEKELFKKTLIEFKKLIKEIEDFE